jgi:hypothetical protein
MNILHACSSLSVDAGGPSRSVSELAAAIQSDTCKVGLVRMQAGALSEVQFSNEIRSLYLGSNYKLQDSTGSEVLFAFGIIHSHGI